MEIQTAQDLAPSEARKLTAQIQQGVQSLQQLIVKAYLGRVWIALGHASWHAYCDAELDGARPSLALAERQAAVGELRQAGMSNVAIGSALGVAEKTVRRDLAYSANAEDLPDRITGTDGVSRPATTRPAPAPPSPVARPAPAPKPATVRPAPALAPVIWSSEQSALRDQVQSGLAVVASLRGEHAQLIEWARTQGLLERVDRRTMWGNPFETPADGDRDAVIRNYADHYLPFKPSLMKQIGVLKGKVLTCWCAPLPCHSDVLAKLANR